MSGDEEHIQIRSSTLVAFAAMTASPERLHDLEEVVANALEHRVDPDRVGVRLHRWRAQTFVAPRVDKSLLRSSDPVTRRCALDILRLARLVRLRYFGPEHLAPFHHCDVVSYNSGAPRLLPPESELDVNLHCADVTVSVVHPASGHCDRHSGRAERDRRRRRLTCVREEHTVTMKQLGIYIERMGGYACVSPPRAVGTTPEGFVRASLGFSVGVDAHWLPVFSERELGAVQGRGVLDKEAVEQSLLSTWHPLAPLIALDKGRSWVRMSRADIDIRNECKRLQPARPYIPRVAYDPG